MSNDNDNLFLDTPGQGQPQQNNQQQQSRPQQQNNTQSEQPASPGGWTLADLGRSQQRPNLGGLTDGALALMITTFKEAMERATGRVPDEIAANRFQAIPLQGSRLGSPMSSLLIVLPVTLAGKNFAVTYLCLIEPAGGQQVRSLNDGGSGSYEALFLPTDRLSDKYVRAISEEVASAAPNSTMIIAGRQVITSQTVSELNNKEGTYTIEAIFNNAFDAICGNLQNIKDSIGGQRSAENRINPKTMARNSRLEASFDFSGKQVTDTSGLPIGSDATMKLWYSAPDQDDESEYGRTELAEVRLGLNLYLDQTAKRNTLGFSSHNQQQQITAPFQAVLSVNNITSPPGIPFSLELAQLALAPIAILSNEYRWAEMMRPREKLPSGLRPMYQLRDLAHFLDVPEDVRKELMQAITSNTNDSDLSKFLDLVVQPSVAFGITTSSSCEKSWVVRIFEKIALEKDEYTRNSLISALYDSADILTGGRFRNIFRQMGGSNTTPPVVLAGTPTLIGTFVDTDGVQRDLREINTQAILSRVGGKALDMVEEYQFTIQDDRQPVNKNLADRYGMVSKLFSSVHVVDKAETLVFLPIYLAALNRSLAEASMSPMPTSLEGLHVRRRQLTNGFSGFATHDIGIARAQRGGGGLGGGRGNDGFGGGGYF